jgi:hypothetical protein
MNVNMVFTIPIEFHAPTEDITELALGAKRAVFEKPENLGAHMKPLFIQGHFNRTPIRHMLIDGGREGVLQRASQTGLDTRHECVPSTRHQCVIQWIGDEVDVVQADDEVCIVMAESQVDILGRKMECLSGKDMTGYD